MSHLLAAYLYDTLSARRKRRGARALAFRRFVEASLARGPSSRRSHRASPRRAPRLPFPSPPRLSGRFRRTRDGAPLVPQLPRELERRLLRRRRREVERAPRRGPTAAAADPDLGLSPTHPRSFERRSKVVRTVVDRGAGPRSRTRAPPDDGGSPSRARRRRHLPETMSRRAAAAAPPPPPPAVPDAARADCSSSSAAAVGIPRRPRASRVRPRALSEFERAELGERRRQAPRRGRVPSRVGVGEARAGRRRSPPRAAGGGAPAAQDVPSASRSMSASRVSASLARSAPRPPRPRRAL